MKPVYLQAAGVVTSVGLSLEQTTALTATSISAARATELLNKDFEPMVMALLPDDQLPPLLDTVELAAPNMTARQQRMLSLLELAVADLTAQQELPEKVPMVLAIPERWPVGQDDEQPPVPGNFINLVAEQCQLNLDIANSRLLPYGRAAGLVALQQAIQMLEADCQQVLVAGVDSFLDAELLEQLDQQDRIKADGVMDGFIPGEAAAVLLISRSLMEQVDYQVQLLKPGLVAEPGHRYSEQPYLGEGLAAAVSQAFQAYAETGGKTPVTVVYNSFNGESLMAKEWGVAASRNSAWLDPAFELYHPAENYGDIGAATAPVLLALAAQNKADQPIHQLVFCASDFEGRGAVTVSVIPNN